MDKHDAPPPYSSHVTLTPPTTPAPGSAIPRLANPLSPPNPSAPIDHHHDHHHKPHTRQERRRRSGRHCCAHHHDHKAELHSDCHHPDPQLVHAQYPSQSFTPTPPDLSHHGHSRVRNHMEGRGRCGRRGRHRSGRNRSSSTSSSSSSSSWSSATSANTSGVADDRHAARMNDINTTLHKTHIKEPTGRPLHSLASFILERIRSHHNLDHSAWHKESRAVGGGLKAQKRQAKKMLRAQKRLLKEELKASHRVAKACFRAGNASGDWEHGGCGRRRRDRERHGKLD